MTTTCRTRAALGVLALAAASAAALAQDEPVEIVDAPASPFVGGAQVSFGLPEVRSLDAGSADAPLEPLTFEEEIRLLFSEEVEKGGGSLAESDGPRVGVQGPAAVADTFRTRVDDFARALDARAVVEVAVVRLPAGAPDGLSREALLALVRGGTAEAIFGDRLTVRRGETVRRESVERRTFVSGVEPEVAQEASIAPAVVHELTTGNRLAVHGRALPTGRVALQASLHLSRPEPVARRTGAPAGPIDLPAVRFVSVAVPFVLAEGESGETRVPDPFGDGSVLLRLTLVQAPPAAHGPWRYADLNVPAGDAWPERLFLAPGWVTEPLVEEPFSDEARTGRIDEAHVRLTNSGVTFTTLGWGLAAIEGGPVGAFEEVFESALRTSALSRRIVRTDPAKLGAATWYDPFEGRVTGEVPADAGAAGAPLRLPLRGDTPSVLLVGTWRRLVADLDVEVAQAAVAVQPQVRSHFEGEAVLARLLPAEPGKPPVAEVSHRTCVVLEHTTRPAVLRSQIYGRDAHDDGTQLDVLTTAASRGRVAVGRAPTAELRREGAAAVLEMWSLE